MPLSIGTVGSGNQFAKAIYVGTHSGNQPVLNIYIGTQHSGNQIAYSALSCSANSVSGSRSTVGTLTIGPSTCVVTGGVGPFTYAWSLSSDGGGSETISTPSASNTTFVVAVTAAGSRVLTATCVVTDSATNLTASCQATVQASYTGSQN